MSVNVNVPAVVGVPLRTPLCGLIVSPGGRLFAVGAMKMGGNPPVVDMTAL